MQDKGPYRIKGTLSRVSADLEGIGMLPFVPFPFSPSLGRGDISQFGGCLPISSCLLTFTGMRSAPEGCQQGLRDAARAGKGHDVQYRAV